ncbi:MAG TPA: hypothetical protein VJV79_40405 [Polyangiaceae bacterium]|nr:hypothetical protein [Polyangiaceae bacterium]
MFGLSVGLALTACGDSQSGSPSLGPLPNTFGGFGGAILAQPAGGASNLPSAGKAGESTTLPLPCQNVPRGQVAKIDDFEDRDTAVFPELGREGFWGVVHDNTTGIVVPAGEFAPDVSGVNGSLGAHVKVSGYSDWGALLSTTLSYLADGMRCPYNASGFAGLRFYARGSGRVRVALAIPATQDKEFGGACDSDKGMICYDTHSRFMPLTPEWTLYEMPWAFFVQRNFGTPAPFRPDQVIVVQFAFDSPELPIEFWVDEVSFWDGTPTPVANNPGGTGGNGTGGNGTGGNGTGGYNAGGDHALSSSGAGAGGLAGDGSP